MTTNALILTHDNERWLADCLADVGKAVVVYHQPGIGIYGPLKQLPAVKQPAGLTPSARRVHALADLLDRFPDASKFSTRDDPGVTLKYTRDEARLLVETAPAHSDSNDVAETVTPKTPPQFVRGSTTVPHGNRPRYQCDVVIPYFHGLQWLPQTIEATLAQNAVDVVVHLVNDDAPQDDREIRQQFAGVDNLRWYQNTKNVGPYLSYHGVWRHIATDYFAVQDADDIPSPNRLWRGIDALKQTGTDIYGAAMEQFLDRDCRDEKNIAYVHNTPFHRSGNRSEYAPRGSIVNGTMIVTVEAFERLNGFMDAFPCGCDGEFITRATFAGCRFYIDDQTVAWRRVHDASLSRGGPYKLGTDGRQGVLDEYKRRYPIFAAEAERGEFDPRPWGALDRTDETITRRIQ